MKITYLKGKLQVLDDAGQEIIGVVQATIYLQEDGYKMGLLYVNLDHVRCEDIPRHGDGVRDGGKRDTRPEPE